MWTGKNYFTHLFLKWCLFFYNEVNKIEIINIDPKLLNAYENNAKGHDNVQIKNIAKSIKKYGFKQPVLIDRDNVIIAGHGRVLGALKLKLNTVPCLVADDLTDEQIREYRILDNKLNESYWINDILKFEIEDLDFSEFELDFDFGEETEEPTAKFGGAQGDYKQTKNLDNFFKSDFEIVNSWGIPEIEQIDIDLTGCKFISFGEKASIKNLTNTVIHFYIDDYKFESVWSTPDKWLELFRSCKAVITPDFSNYTDMPKAQQLWNHYRRQWCGKYWQNNGINVIPSLSWANAQIFDFTFYGIPQNTICATSFLCDNIDKKTSIEELVKVLGILKPLQLLIKTNKKDEKELRKAVDFVTIPPYLFKR